MSWFKKRIYPEYWQAYEAHFKQATNNHINSVRFVVFDTETTGLDIKEDRILSIGNVAILNNSIHVIDQLECYLKQDLFKAETVKIHGLLKEGSLKKISEEEAIILFLAHIKDAVLVAHHAAFDVAIINKALRRLGLPKLKNKVLDTGVLFQKTKLDTSKMHFSLDSLSERFNIPQHDRHTASGDAYITALLFLKIIPILKQSNKNLDLKDLLRSNQRIGLL
ncbi:3'-5' exonuclease [Bizionia arctica]|uniref:DNA polymerase III subunit epsilon n=1 Tax=Bizionia arctica TaxID=1495645 RepID=A0A917LPT6_9FLAO|nr:3'-5' exonuclease [Bizionia arctica]GGG50568.1 DNA polymerase III subunit epsilon [Bizionia arctica]